MRPQQYDHGDWERKLIALLREHPWISAAEAWVKLSGGDGGTQETQGPSKAFVARRLRAAKNTMVSKRAKLYVPEE